MGLDSPAPIRGAQQSINQYLSYYQQKQQLTQPQLKWPLGLLSADNPFEGFL